MGINSKYTGGFGGLVTINYFHQLKIGGIYIGGGLSYIFSSYSASSSDQYWNGYTYDYRYTEYKISNNFFSIGLNAGYRFITNSGLYFRAGGYLGLGFTSVSVDGYKDISDNYSNNSPIYFKPDVSIGYSF